MDVALKANAPLGRTQVERTQEARQKIIDAAFVCMAEKGYVGASLIDIAQQAGVSRELPRYHFGSKEGLLGALLDELAQYWSGVLCAADLPEPTLAEALSRMGEMLNRDYPIMRGHASLMFGAADPSNAILRRESLKIQKSIHKALEAVFVAELLRRGGGKTAKVDAAVYVSMTFAAFRGLLYQMTIENTRHVARATWEEFCKMILKSIERRNKLGAENGIRRG